MGNKTETEKKPRKKIRAVIAGLLVFALVCGIAGCQMIATKDTAGQETDAKSEELQQDKDSANANGETASAEDGNSFTEEGTTSMSTVSQLPEFSLTTAFMYVEEVYVEAGSTVAEGDALFKITEDSIAEAEAYYEKRIASARDYLNEVQLAYEAGELSAAYTKLDAESAAESAATTLETSLQELEDEVTSKYTKWQDAVSKINTYNSNLNSNVYYTYSGIDAKTTALADAETAAETAQAEYETATAAYQSAEAQFEAAMATVNGIVDGTIAESDDVTLEQAATNMVNTYYAMENAESVYEEKRTANEQATQNVQKASQELEQAKLTYEKNVEQAKSSLEQLESTVDTLQQAYESASLQAETKRLALQNTYELSVLEGQYAEANYNATVESLANTVSNAQKSLDTLLEAQEALLALEDGVVVASQAGTLAAVNYEAGDILISGVAFVTYYETDTLTISVEVEQENIAKIAVGDEVSVTISNSRRGNVTGTVASIASSATTGRSVSDVTYAVVISIDNSGNSLSAGQSATVTFEYGE